ncbi:unnamed protein product [Ostreobium quekettii]|uniref:ZN622/Rei1/Reh1 zinc finger C2H2-type domain-containing protein n=1 Tax=Ostreobium quekettii TaxID=121088 RepID=A0A8S1JDS5_9CHLO|nr:unnamed protein product [Ostreobium quekettii]|eukprot:evm.model.scf_1377.4 EVM.evm.TU.scf_1377.4   scf_1377:14333-18068(-)
MAAEGSDGGLYCSTSGTYFTDKDALTQHYRSDFHIYNLRRKVAGLPPVTKEWFDGRKHQIARAASKSSPGAGNRVWIDPLTQKKFSSEKTYASFVRSKKYKRLVAESGGTAPEPIVVEKRAKEGADSGNKKALGVHSQGGYRSKPTTYRPVKGESEGPAATLEDAKSDSGDSSSEWETASDEDAAVMEDGKSGKVDKWEEWNVCRSLFDSHSSATFDDNLEYMYKKFGFFFPDAEHLTDPQGLLKYLGAKLQHGCVPLWSRGDDPNPKRFRSLHAVQRHMIDTNRCRMLFEDNEEEYEDFYDLAYLYEPEGGQELVAGDEAGLGTGGYELVLTGEGGREKIVGTREFARYYKQKHRPTEARESVLINQIVAKYRSLGIQTASSPSPEEKRSRRSARKHQETVRMRVELRSNVNNHLPRNVPY